jgi:hypothetical protein
MGAEEFALIYTSAASCQSKKGECWLGWFQVRAQPRLKKMPEKRLPYVHPGNFSPPSHFDFFFAILPLQSVLDRSRRPESVTTPYSVKAWI